MNAPIYPRVGTSRLRPPVVKSDIFPWLGDEVSDAVGAGWDNGIRSREGLLLLALSEVYPVTPTGTPLTWPAVPGDHAAIGALEARDEIP